MQLHVLGAGGAVPTASRGPSAYWLVVDGHGLLLEAGSGALVRLLRQRSAPDRLDAVDTVVLSHLHLDHAADLAPLLFALHSELSTSDVPLMLAGPQGLVGYLARLRDLYGDWIEPRNRRVIVREHEPGDGFYLPGGGRADAFAVQHAERRFSRQCLGWVFTDAAGRRLVYSGDTGPCTALEDNARGCDILLVECSAPDGLAVDGHLTPNLIVELIGRARPMRAVLTHLYPVVAEQQPDVAIARATGVPCHAARDGDVYSVGDPVGLP